MGRVHQQKKALNTLPFLIVEGAGGQTQFFEKKSHRFQFITTPLQTKKLI